MLDLLFIPTAILYLIVVGSLFIYGVNFFYLTYLTWRRGEQRSEEITIEEWPVVTVQLPIYNELYVASRLILAAAKLDYPRDLLEIQVLDDSDDETALLVAKQVAELCEQGINILHLHRRERSGYKAGALMEGLHQARGEFLAIFDADFIPPADFLKRTIPHFYKDPGVGFVQARWGHVNRDYSVLTYLQSLSIDAHFMVEQFARSQNGYWFNFNGTAGIWRRQAMIDAGGWKAETLTEDLDLSYRAFFKGWRAVYLRDLEVPAELPVSFSAYRRQQQRWARGSLECARKFLPQIWESAAPFSLKMEATLHLTGYVVHLLLFALVFLYPLILVLSQRYSNLLTLFGIAFLFNATALAPTAFFAVAQQQLGHTWWKKVPAILCISCLGAGMMVNTVWAALQVYTSRPGVFERTPKFGIRRRGEDWTRSRYQLRLDAIVYFELLLALVNMGTVYMAVRAQNWLIAYYSLSFCLGLLFTSGMSIVQALAVQRRKRMATHG
ncbi:MAG: glycosyltransferase [Chloroflexi bacterium]|jgi:cellulose synthase/poly-beta-1,6-N-acetylglucosamine synthase-like glycosyltransferase|nr:glycosyltransferase [Chloroflexota bacterium]